MVLLALAVVATLAADLSTAQRVLPVGIQRSSHRTLSTPVNRRSDTYTQTLNNNITGAGYYADVSLGTPPQKVTLILDTGSADVWVVSKGASLCRSEIQQEEYGYCLATYDPDASSTYNLVASDDFGIQYVDGSQAIGDYIKDDFQIGGANISQLQMGLASRTTIPTGIIGIGFDTNESAEDLYPNIIDLLVSQGLIASKAYSLYLNDYSSNSGTILFGGIDKKKFVGELAELDLIEDEQSGDITSFTVPLQSFELSIGGESKASSDDAIPVILDSGTTWSYLPSDTAEQVFEALNAYDDSQTRSGSGFVFVDCNYLSQNVTMSFQFGSKSGPVISVPVDEMVFDNVDYLKTLGLLVPDDLPFDSSDACTLGLTGSDDYYLLGDTFLRSAYVVYDLSNERVALAQANLNSTESDIVEITAGSDLPDVTGVASQVQVTQTATGRPGVGDGDGATGSPSATGKTSGGSSSTTTSGATTSTSGNAGARTAPKMEWAAVWVAGVAGLSVLAGGAVFSL